MMISSIKEGYVVGNNTTKIIRSFTVEINQLYVLESAKGSAKGNSGIRFDLLNGVNKNCVVKKNFFGIFH